MTPERRRWPRQTPERGLSVTLTADGWYRPCRITDVAPGGLEVRLTGAPPRNREVRLHHPLAGTIYSRWVWADDGAMGLAFDNPVRAQAFLSEILGETAASIAKTLGDRPDTQGQGLPLTV